MKKIAIAFVTISLIIITGCKSGNTENPKDVLHDFFSALSKKDFDGAKKFATKDSDGMISMMQMGMQHMQGMDNSHADKMLDMVNNMRMDNAVIKGKEATVTVTDTKTNESTDFLLKKEDGAWKVAFDMSTLMEMANKKMREHGMQDLDTGKINKAVDSLMKNVPQAPQMPDTAQKTK